jgi:hypothetical protein
MHFEIRAEDDSSSVWCSFVLLVLYAIGHFFDLDYLGCGNQSVSGVLWCILVFFAIFEMYNLQVASSEFQVLKVLC